MNMSKKKYRVLVAVKHNGKWGFIDTQGKTVVPFKYEATDHFCRGIAPVQLSSKWGFINNEGQEIIPPRYEDYAVIHNESDYGFYWCGYIQVKHNKKWGYIDLKGNPVISFRYDECSGFIKKSAIVRIKNKKNVIDMSGNTVLPLWFDDILISGGHIEKWHLFIIKQKGYYGVIHRSGKWVIPCIYESIFRINNFFEVFKNHKWGILNRQGKEILPCIYDDLFYHGNLIWKITLNNHCKLFSLRRKIKNPTFDNQLKQTILSHKLCEVFQAEEMTDFIYKKICVYADRIIAQYCGKWGITDYDGHIMLPFIYDEIWNGGIYWYAGIATNWDLKWHIIDLDGNIIFSLPDTFPYEIQALYTENMLLCRNGKYTLVDYNGRFLIPEEFDDIITINKTLFAIRKNGCWALFDTNKGLLNDLEYSPLFGFSNIKLVQKDGKYGFINYLGEIIIPIIYEDYYGSFRRTDEINKSFYAGNDLIKFSND